MFQKTARSQLQMKGKRSLPFLLLSVILPIASSANAQVGGLLWEENFNTLDPSIWKIDEGNGCEIGLCGWGNLEREYYSPNNVSIEAVPGEAGNNALVMEARSENATDTFGNNFVYTSGKIHSENGLAVQYGMIETRIRVPDLQNGLWPAFWMLGTTTAGWPRKGELDIMEMGQSDAGIISHGHPGTPQNNFVGANAIFYSDDACVVGNETCAASTAYQTDNAYVSTVPMNDRFIVYRMYWTDTEIRFTAIDQGVEYDMYDNPIPITEESAELAEPFYFLMNLAIGGNFTGFLNDSEISAPLPAKMYVDYIRVYEFNGLGEVTEGNFANQEFGTFGVFTDNAVVDNQLEPGVNSDIFIWNTNSTGGGTEAPYEGENAISWEYHTPGLWFGGGVQARQPLDMSSFLENGNLTFNIKIPANISFRIGITDTFTNQNWVVFPANQTAYGLVRDGEWGSVTIPVSELQGELIALQSTEYPFAIVSVDADLPTDTFQFAIDNILWEGGGDAPVDDNAPEPGTNLALNQTTSQSSTRFNGQSARAVDGNTSGVYRDASVTHTASENEPWWQVDLGSVEDITHINIFNRTDSCCVSRLTDFYVFVSDVPFTSSSVAQTVNSNQVSSVYYDGTLNGSDTITVNTQGQYVRIQLIGTNPLSLAEVEVIAGEAPLAPPRTAVLVETEDYTAFLDTDAGNNGNQYRSDDVDIEVSSDENGGFNVGWTASGEWLEYSAQLQAGSYEIESRVASVTDTGEFLISINQQVVGSATVDATGGWQNWVTLPSGEVNIPSDGTYTIRIDVTGSSFNINYFTLLPVDSDVGTTVPEGDPNTDPDPDNGNGGGTPVASNDADGDGIIDTQDQCPLTSSGTPVDVGGCPAIIQGEITNLFSQSTPLAPAITFDRGDALVTKIADRGRDRHAREDQFQAYDHYLTFYWENRTATIEIVDYVAKGGDTIEMTMNTQWPLESFDNRWLYFGVNTVAEYYDNGPMTQIGPMTYIKSNSFNIREAANYKIGDRLEFEPSQFLQIANLPRGRDNYYGTTYLYIVGEGLVPWDTTDNELVQGGPRHQEDSFPIPIHARMGGETTLHANHTNEPDNHFMQMATNLSALNGQSFVLGRRVHHSSFVDGTHDENPQNGVFTDTLNLAGNHYIQSSCAGCHIRNGRASVADNGELLDKWVVKIGDASGQPEPLRGSVLQPKNINSTQSEGSVSIASWTEIGANLRTPNYSFDSQPATFSARIAPNIYGVGLLEAVSESEIIANADPTDSDEDGISGRVSKVIDPISGDVKLGRFGYKAGAFSLSHQVAKALNTDMGVMSEILPNPDCGSAQTDCGVSGAEISAQNFSNLVKYIALLGVRPQRNYDNTEVLQGQTLFNDSGCTSCHVPTLQTSEYTELAEVRAQTIHPYTDLLLHDMGEGLADNLGEGNATGAEWRTAPLWGIGLSACVTGGVINPVGGQGNEVCSPDGNFLHDGRARSIDEAIRWHGGEAQSANDAYQGLTTSEKNALVSFVASL